MSNRYKILYTHQKLKKKKTWQDGYLDICAGGKKGRVLSEEFKELDSLFVKEKEVVNDAELESDRYMITVEYKCIGDDGEGKENNLSTDSVPVFQKLDRNVLFKRPPLKVAVKKLGEHFKSSYKPKVPLHPSMCMPLSHDTSILSPSQVTTENHASTLPLKTERVGDLRSLQKLSFISNSSISVKTNSGRYKRSTDEILSLFDDEMDDDISRSNVLCTSEEIELSSSSLVCDAMSNYGNKPKDCVKHETTETNDFLGLNKSGGNSDINSGIVNPLPRETSVSICRNNSYADIDEETDCVDDFADDFLDTENDIFGISNSVPVNNLNDKNNIMILDGPDKPTHFQHSYRRIADISEVFPKKRCINYGNVGNLQTQDIPIKRQIRKSFSAPSKSYGNVLYKFPSKEEVFQKTSPKRNITIPIVFDSVTSYKLIFKSVINEHINIILFDLAGRYHNAIENADVSAIQYGTISNNVTSVQVPTCSHGPAKMNAVRKEGKNKGRLFYACSQIGSQKCNFFQWADEVKTSDSARDGVVKTSKIFLNDYNSVTAYFNSHGIQFYYNIKFLRKVPYKQFFRGKKSGVDLTSKKDLYISLPHKKASSFYGKDDIWVISKSIDFVPGSTFVAKSVFYGPKSNGELEIHPLCSYSAPNWQNGELCYAIQAFNAATELTCSDNIDTFVNVLDVPVLSSLLSLTSTSSRFNVSSTRFNLSSVPHDEILDLVHNTAASFSLNEDQCASLENIASMFVSGKSQNVTLIHGVFGAGKSYLLSVVVLFLVQLFELIENRFQLDVKLKLMFSSITNVAVDRVMSMLLDHGFDEFIRIGSVKKIAKQVLPYSVHACDKDDQELKELNDLMSSEITEEERGYVKKAIELHKLGVNRKKLSVVRVVGVTCAACVFPFLQNNDFHVQLQDECSQMMEPVSMLPVARFKCDRLILVGDPKQLSPTIQGSEAEHSFSLEMTLFERLQQLGYQPSMLRTQYRCHPSISALCNEMFYDGQLKDGITCNQREPMVEWLPTLLVVDCDDGREENGSDGSYFNLKEADITVRLLVKLLKTETDPEQVGVITQYKSQVWKINSLLRGFVSTSDNLMKSIQISTVDAFQGAEKDIIVLSCVRTRHIGFIDCHRRTNVALSRAKKHLIIVGKLKLLKSNPCWSGVLNVCRKQHATFTKSNLFLKSLSS